MLDSIGGLAHPTTRLQPGELAGSNELALPTETTTAPSSSGELAGDFGKAVRGLLDDVETSQVSANQMKRDLLTGEPVELHEVLLAVEKAQLSFQTLLAVRTKVLEAYQEVSRMPL